MLFMSKIDYSVTRTLQKDREESKDSKATLNNAEDHSGVSSVDSELGPSTPDPLDLQPFIEAPYVYVGEEGTIMRRQSLPPVVSVFAKVIRMVQTRLNLPDSPRLVVGP